MAKTIANSHILAKGLRVFKTTYTAGAGTASQAAEKWYIEFRFDGRPRRVPAFADLAASRELALQLHRLALTRQTNGILDQTMAAWIEAMPPKLRGQLVKIGVLEGLRLSGARSLVDHLGEWKAAMLAKGTTGDHAAVQHNRVKRIFDGCGMALWQDLSMPGAASGVQGFLGRLRSAGSITGASFNYYVKALRAFCAWMVKDKRVASNPFADLEGVNDAESDAKRERRGITVEELRWLLKVTPTQPERFGMTAADRGLLYRFAFKTGLRPKQIRSLIVSSFDLDTTPPVVNAAAKFVKRRRRHVQVLTRHTAEALRTMLANKMPAAAAFILPRPERIVTMFREDLDAARAEWIKAAPEGKDRVKRQRSDFLARQSHDGQWVVFYSLRHGHGNALAEAGVPQRDITASLHHTRSATTDRYVRGNQKTLAIAINSLPDLSPLIDGPPQLEAQQATGTDGGAAHPPVAELAKAEAQRLARRLARGRAQHGVGGAQTAGAGRAASANKKPAEISGNPLISEGFHEVGRAGIEPATHGFSVHVDHLPTSEQPKTSEPAAERLARYLAQEDARLIALLEVWADLPEYVRCTIDAIRLGVKVTQREQQPKELQ